MYNSEFENLPFDRRESKPRKSGLTVLIDRYFGVNLQKDFLDYTIKH
jgi:phosphosulfolactate synthase (CoM biosynthesis protein A)